MVSKMAIPPPLSGEVIMMLLFLAKFKKVEIYLLDPIYPTPPLGQDMTQGQFLSGV